jgi:hypothetical protein
LLVLLARGQDAAQVVVSENLGAPELGEERIAEAIGRMISQPTLQPAVTLVKPPGCFVHVINSCRIFFSGEMHRHHPVSSSCMLRRSHVVWIKNRTSGPRFLVEGVTAVTAETALTWLMSWFPQLAQFAQWGL